LMRASRILPDHSPCARSRLSVFTFPISQPIVLRKRESGLHRCAGLVPHQQHNPGVRESCWLLPGRASRRAVPLCACATSERIAEPARRPASPPCAETGAAPAFLVRRPPGPSVCEETGRQLAVRAQEAVEADRVFGRSSALGEGNEPLACTPSCRSHGMRNERVEEGRSSLVSEKRAGPPI
jgi:hypothetical protein